jgi:hypothetical protein
MRNVAKRPAVATPPDDRQVLRPIRFRGAGRDPNPYHGLIAQPATLPSFSDDSTQTSLRGARD